MKRFFTRITAIINRIRTRIEHALTAPGQEISYWAGLIRYQVQLWQFCGRRLRENNSMAMSAALSFRTIFALIPVLVLSLMILRVAVSPEESRDFVRDNLARAGISEAIAVPADENADPGSEATPPVNGLESMTAGGQSSDRPQNEALKPVNLVDQIMALVDRVDQKLTFQRIGPVGFILLIWTAITLITTVERSLNRIYRAPQSRALVRRVMLYWSVLTLVPIVMFVTIYLQERIVTIIKTLPGLSGLLHFAGWLGPVIIGIIMVAALYCLLPNTRISLRSALGGALVAYPLWLTAKWLFGLYVFYFVRTGSLYGTLGLLPVFLMWLNLSWTIFLFGAELSHTASNLKRMQAAEIAARIHLTPLDFLAAAFIIARRYQAGAGAVPYETLSEQMGLPYESVQNLVERLTGNRIICATGPETHPAYVLARPAEKIPIGDILEINQNGCQEPDHGNSPSIQKTIRQFMNRLSGVLDQVTLSDLINEEPNHEKNNLSQRFVCDAVGVAGRVYRQSGDR